MKPHQTLRLIPLSVVAAFLANATGAFASLSGLGSIWAKYFFLLSR
jgi:hypothetical protein